MTEASPAPSLKIDEICPFEKGESLEKVMQNAYRASFHWVRWEQKTSKLLRALKQRASSTLDAATVEILSQLKEAEDRYPLYRCFELVVKSSERAADVFPGVAMTLNRDTPNFPWALIATKDARWGVVALLTMPDSTHRYMARAQALDVFNPASRDFEPVDMNSRRGLDRLIFEALNSLKF